MTRETERERRQRERREIREQQKAVEALQRDRERQGLGSTIDDPVVYAAWAAIVRPAYQRWLNEQLAEARRARRERRKRSQQEEEPAE